MELVAFRGAPCGKNPVATADATSITHSASRRTRKENTCSLLTPQLRDLTPATGFGMYEEALSDTNDPGVEQTILSRNNLSHDEIFSIVLDRNDGRKGR